MKKLSLLMGAAVIALGFGSCAPDRDPQYHNPTEFVLNVPVLQDQYIELSETGTLDLVASQPDYGYSAVANYSAEVSLTSDFAEYEALEAVNPHQAAMQIKDGDVALAVCSLLGLSEFTDDDFKKLYPNGFDYMPLYFRAVCELDGVPGSLIYSNVVSYKHIRPYFAVPTQGVIWIIGNVSGGWIEPAESNAAELAPWRLFEPINAIGSKVYTGTFELPAQPMFRFYSALNGWDSNTYGVRVDNDDNEDFPEFTGEKEFTHTLIEGKGNFNFPEFGGGEVTIVVDMSNPKDMTFTMYPGAQEVTVYTYVYWVGNLPSPNWTLPTEDNVGEFVGSRLGCADGSGVYAGIIDCTEMTDDLNGRVFEVGDGSEWTAQWAAGEADFNDVPTPLGVETNTTVGKSNFNVVGSAGHKINVVLDTNENTIVFTIADED